MSTFGRTNNMSTVIGRGRKHRCRMSGWYFHESEMVPWFKGGWIAKRYDYLIDPIQEKSRFASGHNWQRGFN